jgi:hypothetical protein
MLRRYSPSGHCSSLNFCQKVREDVEYVFKQYGNHPALYRDVSGRPLFYVRSVSSSPLRWYSFAGSQLYDSYQVTPGEWARLLQPSGRKILSKCSSCFLTVHRGHQHTRHWRRRHDDWLGGRSVSYFRFVAVLLSGK